MTGKYSRISIVAVIGIVLSGCAVYGSREATLKVEFDQELPAGTARTTARGIKSLAVWPSGSNMVPIIQEIERQSNIEIVSPAKINAIMVKKQKDTTLAGLLEREREELFRIACKSANMDSIYSYIRNPGIDIEQPPVFIGVFKKRKSRISFEHRIYHCKSGRNLLAEQGNLVYTGTYSTSPNLKLVEAKALANRVVEYIE